MASQDYSATVDKGVKIRDQVDARAAVRAEALKWVSIFLGSLIILDRIEPILKMAGVVRKAIQHWREISHWFWTHALGLFGIVPESETVVALNICGFFVVVLAATARSMPSKNWWIGVPLFFVNIFIIMLSTGFLAAAQQLHEPIGDFAERALRISTQFPDEQRTQAGKALLRDIQENKEYYARQFLMFTLMLQFYQSNQVALFKALLKLGVGVSVLLGLNFLAVHAADIKALLN